MPGLKSIPPALLTGLLLSNSLAAAEWVKLEEGSHLAFHGQMLGVPAVGYFRRFESEITFDPDDLENAHVVIVVDMSSADSSHEERDTALKLPEWFATRIFPEARFEAREFHRKSDTAYEAAGSLTIKGTSRDIALPFTLAIDNGTAIVSGRLNLSRKEFGIGTGDWANDRLVAFDVLVEFSLVAQTSPSP